MADIVLRLIIDGKEFNATVKDADKQLHGLQQSVQQQSQKMVSSFKSVAQAVGLAFGVATIVNFSKQSVQALIQQEQAEKSLTTALGRKSLALQQYASELQKVTTFGDEQILQGMALIAMFVKDENAIKRLSYATLQLAAAKKMDLVSAFDLVSKTVGSSTNALSRYGIEIEGAAGSTERINNLVNRTIELMGGQAEAEAETLGGSLTQVNNRVGDLQENVAKGLVPALERLLDITNQLLNLTGEGDTSGLGWAVGGAVDIATWFVRYVTIPILNTLKEAYDFWSDLIGGEDANSLQSTSDEMKKARAEIEAMMSDNKKITDQWTEQGKTVKEIKERITELAKQYEDSIPGTAQQLKLVAEITRLEALVTIEKKKQKELLTPGEVPKITIADELPEGDDIILENHKWQEISRLKIEAMKDGFQKEAAIIDQWYAEEKETELYKESIEARYAIDEIYQNKKLELARKTAEQEYYLVNDFLTRIEGLFGRHTFLSQAIIALRSISGLVTSASALFNAAGGSGGGFNFVSLLSNFFTGGFFGFAKGGAAIVGENGTPEIIAPIEDYAEGNRLLVAKTVMAVESTLNGLNRSDSISHKLDDVIAAFENKQFSIDLFELRTAQKRIEGIISRLETK